MNIYIKPLIIEYHVLSSCHLLSGSPGEGTNTLTSEEVLINNQVESGIQQLSKEDSFSVFSLSDTKTDWNE